MFVYELLQYDCHLNYRTSLKGKPPFNYAQDVLVHTSPLTSVVLSKVRKTHRTLAVRPLLYLCVHDCVYVYHS